MTKGDHRYIWYAMPGLIILALAALRIYPPAVVMAEGHPDYSYYAYSFSHWAYSDIVALYGSRRLYLHTWPYFQNVIEYPVVIGVFMSLMARLPGFIGYFIGTVVGLALAYMAAFYALTKMTGKRALWLSLSPLLFVYGLLNWDLLGIAAWGLGLLAYSRRKYGTSGIWIGIGIATKFFPIVLIPYLGAHLMLERRQAHEKSSDLARFLWGTGALAVGINLPFSLWAERGWSEFFTYNSGRPPDPGIWGALVGRHWLSIADVNLLSLLLTSLGGLILLWWVYRRGLSPIFASAAALAWWFLCNKVYSPQYLFWIYYAFLWVDLDPVPLVAMNMAGLFDFSLAMQWLGLGTTGNPFLSIFVSTVVAPVIAVRDTVIAWASAMPVLLRGRSRV